MKSLMILILNKNNSNVVTRTCLNRYLHRYLRSVYTKRMRFLKKNTKLKVSSVKKTRMNLVVNSQYKGLSHITKCCLISAINKQQPKLYLETLPSLRKTTKRVVMIV